MNSVARNYNPAMLRWARENLDLSLDQAVDIFFNFSPERLDKFEKGEAHPTKNQLQIIAEKYGTSILTFYLDHPPTSNGNDGLAEFRMPREQFSAKERALTKLYLQNLLLRHELLKDLLEDLDEIMPVDYIGLIEVGNTISVAASKVRERFDLDALLTEPNGKKRNRALFSELRKQCEINGIFVLMAGYSETRNFKLEHYVFRGISIPDAIAPLMVINSNESKNGRSFTLLHELIHICLGSVGIWRNPNDFNIGDSNNCVEQFCNDVASEVLLPASAIRELRQFHDFDVAEQTIGETANRWSVSEFLVAYRLYRAGAISWPWFNSMANLFRRRWKAEEERKRKQQENKTGGPSYFVVKRANIGGPMIELVRRGVRSGELRHTDAARLLGVKVDGVSKMLVASDGIEGK